jgi:hypothetical protein
MAMCQESDQQLKMQKQDELLTDERLESSIMWISEIVLEVR